MQRDISKAIHLCRIEWASLPGSPHGQLTANKKMLWENMRFTYPKNKKVKQIYMSLQKK